MRDGGPLDAPRGSITWSILSDPERGAVGSFRAWQNAMLVIERHKRHPAVEDTLATWAVAYSFQYTC